MPGGTSSRWWVTRISGGAVGIGGQLGERLHELLAAAEVEAGARLVEQQDRRLVHQRAGQQHPLLLARRRRRQAAARPARRRPSGRGTPAPGPRRPRRSGATTAPARRTWPSSRRRGSAARGAAARPATATCSRCGGAARGRRCARAARRAPARRRSTGCSYIAAMRSSVVLPEPLAPSTTQRCSGEHLPRQRRQDRAAVADETDVDQTQDLLTRRGVRLSDTNCDDIATRE